MVCGGDYPFAPAICSATFLAKTSIGTFPPFTTASLNECPAPATRTTSAAGGAGGTAKVPAFRASIKTVTAKDLASSWRKGCPVPVAKLRAVDVTHWNRAGAVQTGRLVVAADKAASVVKIMRDLYNARFPIQRMQPIEAFKGNDNASMAANNTSAFNCRRTTGGSSWSEHSYGRAIDVNPLMNPYVRGRLVLPPAGAPYRDRKRKVPGMIHAGDAVVRAFAARGWAWGGNWKTLKDYQHFSTTGR